MRNSWFKARFHKYFTQNNFGGPCITCKICLFPKRRGHVRQRQRRLFVQMCEHRRFVQVRLQERIRAYVGHQNV